MAKEVVCPYCFEKFRRSDVMFRCTNNSCEMGLDDAMTNFWGNDMRLLPAFDNDLGKWGKLMDKMPDSATCPRCQHDSHTVICPHCHNVIPKEMVEHSGRIISIIGARSSGKTNYITVLIDQLRKHGSKLGNLGVMASTVADERRNSTHVRYKTDFYDVLFKNCRVFGQTQVGDRASKIPLIFTINQKGLDAPFYLVLYDTAGENFNDPKNIRDNVKFLNESDAVIFLLDTFSIPYIHDALGIKAEIESSFDEILGNVVDHFAQGEKALKDAHLRKPMAFVFSKIDAILRHGERFADTAIPGMSLTADSPFLDGNGVLLSDMDTVSQGLQQALAAWGENNFLQVISQYRNAKFFGVSSLGKDPDADNTIKNIKPYRVLDPLVWILHEFGYPLRIIKEKK